MLGAAHAHVHANEPRPQTRPARNRAPVQTISSRGFFSIINSATNEINSGNVITFGSWVVSFPLFFFFLPSASFLLINFLRSCPRFGGGEMRWKCSAFVFKEDEGLGTSQRRCEQRRANFYGASSLGYHVTGRLHGDERRSLREGRKPPSCEVIFCHRGGFLASSLLISHCKLLKPRSLPPPQFCVLLLISLLCKVRRVDAATLRGVFGFHLYARRLTTCRWRTLADRLRLVKAKISGQGGGYFNQTLTVILGTNGANC